MSQVGVEINEQDALIIIDVQNDFCTGGALAVPQAEDVFVPIQEYANEFSTIILTQDWHPAEHSSFASQYEGHQPLELIDLPYGKQVLWPDHCVQGSHGAAFHQKLDTTRADMIIRKGFRPHIDSYSAFFENDHETPTGLEGYLKNRRIENIYLCGLATDFCVYYSALDALKCGFKVNLLLDACRGIDLDGSLQAALSDMKQKGVKIIS